MFVIASKGLKVPMEDKPTTHINDSQIVQVPDDSAYYARRMIDGDLLESKAEDFEAQQKALAAEQEAQAAAALKDNKKQNKNGV